MTNKRAATTLTELQEVARWYRAVQEVLELLVSQAQEDTERRKRKRQVVVCEVMLHTAEDAIKQVDNAPLGNSTLKIRGRDHRAGPTFAAEVAELQNEMQQLPRATR